MSQLQIRQNVYCVLKYGICYGLDDQGFEYRQGRRFDLLQNVQTRSPAHPASHSVCSGRTSRGSVRLFTHFSPSTQFKERVKLHFQSLCVSYTAWIGTNLPSPMNLWDSVKYVQMKHQLATHHQVEQHRLLWTTIYTDWVSTELALMHCIYPVSSLL